MALIVNRAALLSGALAAALLIQPMCISASTDVLNQSGPSVKALQSHVPYRVWGLAKLALLLRIGASCLLIASCSGLALANSREKQRKNRDQERIAASLAIAVRSGLLDEVQHSDVPVWSMWGEDESDSEPKSLILSRYRMLGYSGELRERAVEGQDLPIRTIVRPDPLEIVTDQELLLGIPRTFVKPDRLPLPWAVDGTSLASDEEAPETGLDSKPYLIPDDVLPATSGFALQ
jgi:hypothetical protein